MRVALLLLIAGTASAEWQVHRWFPSPGPFVRVEFTATPIAFDWIVATESYPAETEAPEENASWVWVSNPACMRLEARTVAEVGEYDLPRSYNSNPIYVGDCPAVIPPPLPIPEPPVAWMTAYGIGALLTLRMLRRTPYGRLLFSNGGQP